MEPVTMALIAGGLMAAGGVAQGVGSARAAKKMMLTKDEEKELRELEKRRRQQSLGLTERELGSIEQRFLSEQAGAQRELEATALQQAAARGLGGASSGRDIFLQEMAQSTAERNLRQQQNIVVNEADRAEKAAEVARIDAMRNQQKSAEAARAQGIAQAVSLGLAGAGQGVSSAASMAQATAMAEADAAARAGSTTSLFNQYNAQKTGPQFNFGQSLPAGGPQVQTNVLGRYFFVDPVTGQRITY